MKSEPYLSAKITDDDHIKVDIKGPASGVMQLLESLAVHLFKEFEKAGCPNTLEVMYLFFMNVTERVFPDDL